MNAFQSLVRAATLMVGATLPATAFAQQAALNSQTGTRVDRCLIDTPTTIGLGDRTFDGCDLVVTGTTVTIDGDHTFRSLRLVNAIATHTAGLEEGMELIVLGDAYLDTLSGINVDLRGWPAQQGPGGSTRVGNHSGGGGYAGAGADHGAVRGGRTYGSITNPTDLGSGGGGSNGGPGGGALRLVVGGTLALDGFLSAGGRDAVHSMGAGSGGSIWLTVGSLTGTGLISALGGAGGQGFGNAGGSGGGGRVAIEYGSIAFDEGNIRARTQGVAPGGAGTIFLKRDSDSRGRLIVDNGGLSGAYTEVNGPAVWDMDVFVRGWGIIGPPRPTGAEPPVRLDLTITGDLHIEDLGAFSASGRGFPTATGIGAGQGTQTSNMGSGAGHGGAGVGFGVFKGGVTYGNITQPVAFGSGGGSPNGGAGGGAIRLVVSGTLAVHPNGVICVDGNPGGGGGSGGSIWVTAGTLAGNASGNAGVICARGGSGSGTNGGGGGRIAVEYGSISTAIPSIEAPGSGAAPSRGGAGTVYLKPAGGPGLLRLDNLGTPGAVTEMASPPFLNADVLVTGGAILGPPRVDAQGQPTALHLAAGGDITVVSTGAVCADGRGYDEYDTPSTHPCGRGGPRSFGAGSGAGHGGVGASTASVDGGCCYGSLFTPVDFGSVGGSQTGGAGGGAVRLTSGGDIHVDGTITAHGLDGGTGFVTGGGSGGSVLLEAQNITGAGLIAADGGSGKNGGGGGAGGRIALRYACSGATSLLTMTVSGSGSAEDGSTYVGSTLPCNGIELSSNDPALARAIPGTLSQQISSINMGPPSIGSGTWIPVLRKEMHQASAFACNPIGVVATGGAAIVVDPSSDIPGSSLLPGSYESDVEVRIFEERVAFTLGVPLAVDVPGTSIPAGTVVNSHFVHFDTVATNTATLTASVSFDSDILGVLFTDTSLDTTDAVIGLPTLNYPVGVAGRGIEITAGDAVTIGPDPRSLLYSGRVQSGLDQVRVITAVPDPIAMPYVSATAFMDGRDEVTHDNCQSAWYGYSFDLPAGFTAASISGRANVDDEGVVFLNGIPISGLLTNPGCNPAAANGPADGCYALQDVGSDLTDAQGLPVLTWPSADCFGTSNTSLFVQTGNELVFGICGDASYWEPTGLEFEAVVEVQVGP